MKTQLKIAGIALFALAVSGRAACAQAAGDFKLQHRSSFANPPARNPFWPIGWVKAGQVPEAPPNTQVTLSPESFVVSSISLSAPPLAIINGKSYAEGETINAIYNGQRIRIQVVAIGDGAVTLQYAGRKITVFIKRALSGPKPEPGESTPPGSTLILH